MNWVSVTAVLFVVPFLRIASLEAQGSTSTADQRVSSVKARYLVGFDHVRKGTDGTLEYHDNEVVFNDSTTIEAIRRDELVDVFLGTERAEKGGTTGHVARFVVPYGGGAVLGAVSEKEVGILTIDFRDRNGSLHSAVFVMQKAEAIAAVRTLAPTEDQKDALHLDGSCHTDAAVGNMRIIELGAAANIFLPAEYRAIMYEHLLSLPEKKTHTPRLFRLGDPSGNCAPLSLSLQVIGLSKGNAVVRASSGPIGLFAGVTSMRVHVTITAGSGRVVLDCVEKGTRRGDKESLNAAVSVADKIGKDLRKAQREFAGQ